MGHSRAPRVLAISGTQASRLHLYHREGGSIFARERDAHPERSSTHLKLIPVLNGNPQGVRLRVDGMTVTDLHSPYK